MTSAKMEWKRRWPDRFVTIRVLHDAGEESGTTVGIHDVFVGVLSGFIRVVVHGTLLPI